MKQEMLNLGQVIDAVRNWGQGSGCCKLLITDTFIGDTCKGISTGISNGHYVGLVEKTYS